MVLVENVNNIASCRQMAGRMSAPKRKCRRQNCSMSVRSTSQHSATRLPLNAQKTAGPPPRPNINSPSKYCPFNGSFRDHRERGGYYVPSTFTVAQLRHGIGRLRSITVFVQTRTGSYMGGLGGLRRWNAILDPHLHACISLTSFSLFHILRISVYQCNVEGMTLSGGHSVVLSLRLSLRGRNAACF